MHNVNSGNQKDTAYSVKYWTASLKHCEWFSFPWGLSVLYMRGSYRPTGNQLAMASERLELLGGEGCVIPGCRSYMTLELALAKAILDIQ